MPASPRPETGSWQSSQARRRIAVHANRVTSLLRQRGVVDDQPGIVAANQPVGFDQQGRFERGCIPDAAADEMMKLVIAYAAITCRHRLNALAIARADQPRYIGGAHPPTRSMPKRIDERLKCIIVWTNVSSMGGNATLKLDAFDGRIIFAGVTPR